MQAWNENPKPFIWSAIIKKIDRARVKMEQIKPGSTQPGEKEGGYSVKLYTGHTTSLITSYRRARSKRSLGVPGMYPARKRSCAWTSPGRL